MPPMLLPMVPLVEQDHLVVPLRRPVVLVAWSESRSPSPVRTVSAAQSPEAEAEAAEPRRITSMAQTAVGMALAEEPEERA